MPIQPNKNNLITYASLKGDRRSFTGNQRKDDYINKQLLTGEWGYDEATGGLSKLDSPIDVSQNAQTLGRSDYYSSGYNLNEEELVQAYINGDNKSQRAKDAYITKGFNSAMYNPVFKAAAYMTPPGMAIGAMEGAAHLIPDSYNFAQYPSWGNAGSVGMDLLMMAPGAIGAGKEVSKTFSRVLRTPEMKEAINNSESLRSRVNALRYLKTRATPGKYKKATQALEEANAENTKYWNAPETEEAFKELFKGAPFIPTIGDKFKGGKGLLASGKIDGVASRHGIVPSPVGGPIESIRNQAYINKFPSFKDVMNRAWKGEEQLLGLKSNPEGLSYTSGISKGSPYQYGNRHIDDIDPKVFDSTTNWKGNPKEVLRRQNYVDPTLSPEAIKSTVRHEGNHGITSDGLADSHQASTLLQKAWNFTDDLGERVTHPIHGEGFTLNEHGKYLTNNHEMYARMQELRGGMKIKPGQKVTVEGLHSGLTNHIEQFQKSEISPQFFNAINVKGMAKAMNGLPLVAGAAFIGPENDPTIDNKNMKYKKGGWFQSSKAGRGVRDAGRLAVNSALTPIEGLIGTDFGFDEKYGYSNDWAKKASKVTEGIGTTIGGVANAYVNTIVPGSGAALNAVGSGMESAGVTQAQDGVGAIGTDVGKAAGIFMGGEPPVMAKNGMKHSKYGKGGKVDLEAEGGEVVLTQGGSPNAVNDNASMTKIGEGAFKINGSSHNNGGVDIQMPSGESMIINKKDAPHAQKLIKLIGTAKDDSASNDFITKATGDLNSKKYTAELNAMVEAQQARNGNKSNSSVASAGTGW